MTESPAFATPLIIRRLLYTFAVRATFCGCKTPKKPLGPEVELSYTLPFGFADFWP